MNGGGVIGALVFVIGVLIAFSVLFGFFLVLPFFVFLAGIAAMLISDRKRNKDEKDDEETDAALEAEEVTARAGQVKS